MLEGGGVAKNPIVWDRGWASPYESHYGWGQDILDSIVRGYEDDKIIIISDTELNPTCKNIVHNLKCFITSCNLAEVLIFIDECPYCIVKFDEIIMLTWASALPTTGDGILCTFLLISATLSI